MYIRITKNIILDYKINKCIKQYHNELLYKHPKITALMEILQKNNYFFKMKHHITVYITKCTQFQQNKHSTHNM